MFWDGNILCRHVSQQRSVSTLHILHIYVGHVYCVWFGIDEKDSKENKEKVKMMNYKKKRFDVVREMINSCYPETKDICDLGSGEPSITDTIKANRTVKLDSNPNSNPDVVHDLTRKFPFKDDEFDMVVACEIIEHLSDTDFFLKEIKRILKAGGDLIMSCPNICSMRYRLAFMLGIIPAHACKVNGEHIRDFNKSDLTNQLEEYGFFIRDMKTDGVRFRERRFPAPVRFGDSIILLAVNRKIGDLD